MGFSYPCTISGKWLNCVEGLQTSVNTRKLQGFVAWKIDDLSHLSEIDRNKFIPLILEKDMLDIFNQAREILLK